MEYRVVEIGVAFKIKVEINGMEFYSLLNFETIEDAERKINCIKKSAQKREKKR